MLPFLKKKSEKAAATQVPAWHTNFRNYAVLPDTKLVRTSFFVNGVLVLIALSLLLAFSYQEYRLYYLRSQTALAQQENEHNRPTSDRAVALFKKFQAEERKINVDAFLKGQKLVFSDFIIRLSQTKPAGIVFLSVDYRETGVSIRGYAQGISESATSAASMYEKQLKEDAELTTRFSTISMTNVTRDVQAGRLSFEILLNFGQTKPKR